MITRVTIPAARDMGRVSEEQSSLERVRARCLDAMRAAAEAGRTLAKFDFQGIPIDVVSLLFCELASLGYDLREYGATVCIIRWK